MTKSEYNDHVQAFLAEMRAVTDAKNVDYSAGQDDAMTNYYELASAAGVTPFQAWMCLMMKHVTAIMRYSKAGEVVSEPIHGRFIDLANYAMLGSALVKDLAAKNGAK
jgi:hypothetical protein